MNRSTLLSLRLIAAFAFSFAIASSHAAEPSAELQNVRQKVGEMFEMIEPENVNEGPVDGWYEIQKGSIVAYVSADGRYLLQGDMIGLPTRASDPGHDGGHSLAHRRRQPAACQRREQAGATHS